MALLLRLPNGFFSHLKNVPTILASKAQSLFTSPASVSGCSSSVLIFFLRQSLYTGAHVWHGLPCFFTSLAHSSHAHLSATFSQQLSVISFPVFSVITILILSKVPSAYQLTLSCSLSLYLLEPKALFRFKGPCLSGLPLSSQGLEQSLAHSRDSILVC